MSYVKLHRGQDTDYMLKHKPDAFLLLSLVSLRARRYDTTIPDGLEIGEALIGDADSCGISRQRYRTALNWLKAKQILTTRTTNKGTIAKVQNTTVYDINVGAEQPAKEPAINQPATINQPSSNQPSTTNKNTRNQEKKDSTPKSVPDWMPPAEWAAYEQMRKESRKPYTQEARKILLGKLDRFRTRGISVAASLQQSVLNGWTDVYEPKADFETKKLRGKVL